MKLTGIALLSRAYYLYDAGLTPLPLYYASKRPTVYWKPWAAERPSWSEVCKSFLTTLYRGIGILTGPVSNNLVVLDFDTFLAYAQWHASPHFIDTYTVRTARGFHVYLRMDDPPHGTLSMEGGEVKASGYVVAPPSTHPSGAVYSQHGDTAEIARVKNLAATGIVLKLKPERSKQPSPSHTERDPSKGSLIAEIKAAYPLTAFLFSYTELYPSGGDYLMGVCPFHDDTNPSLWVNVEAQVCGCFSPRCVAHDRPFDVINAYSHLTGIRNGEAVFDLARQLELI